MEETIIKLSRHIGNRLRRARQEAGMTGVALSKAIGKSQAFVSDVERGRKLPSLTTLLTIAQTLNKTPEFFIPASFLAGYSGVGEYSDDADQSGDKNRLPSLKGPDIEPGAPFIEVLSAYLADDGQPWVFLEDQADLSPSAINFIRQGYIPPRDVVVKIADALGVDPGPLLVSAGFLSDPASERTLKAILADPQMQKLAFQIASDFTTPRAKAFVLELIASAKALAEEQTKVDDDRITL
jgi:transcriptional regulator with XRE-family HTH domain